MIPLTRPYFPSGTGNPITRRSMPSRSISMGVRVVGCCSASAFSWAWAASLPGGFGRGRNGEGTSLRSAMANGRLPIGKLSSNCISS